MMESKPLKRCICGDMVERHKDSNGKYFIYCSNCHLAFGIKLETCQMYYPGTGDAIFDTAEQARLAWNDWQARLAWNDWTELGEDEVY